jgi:AAA family ATP:ADP antiporter
MGVAGGFATMGPSGRSKPAVTERSTGPRFALMRRLASIEPAERASVAWAFAQFACVLIATFVLRALRDEMGIAGGVKQLPWMFTATFVGTLAVVPVYGWAAARLGRRGLHIAVYGTLAASMLALWAAIAFASAELAPWISRLAFVWLSVVNMVAVAAFWSAIVDVFTAAQGHRLFGLIAAGGTLGALLGPALALVLAELVGHEPIFGASALAFVAAIVCALRLERSVTSASEVVSGARPIGGAVLDGLRDVARPGPLRGIAIYVALYTATSTVLYVVQAEIVEAAIHDPAARTAWFARIDLAVNLLAICAQLALTGAMLRRMALAAILAVLPLVSIVALLVLGAWPTLGLLAIAQTFRRACEHAVAKPGRELLYAQLDRDSKFKGQNAVDTVVYRACDAVSAWLVRAIAELVAGASALLWTFVPVAIMWVWWARRLGASACTHEGRRHDVV